jgi:hypothetical protein
LDCSLFEEWTYHWTRVSKSSIKIKNRYKKNDLLKSCKLNITSAGYQWITKIKKKLRLITFISCKILHHSNLGGDAFGNCYSSTSL